MPVYDFLAILTFGIALAVAVWIFHLEREGRPKSQIFALFTWVIALLVLTAVLIHFGRRPYIPRTTSGVFVPLAPTLLFAIISRQRSRVLIRPLRQSLNEASQQADK